MPPAECVLGAGALTAATLVTSLTLQSSQDHLGPPGQRGVRLKQGAGNRLSVPKATGKHGPRL